MPVTIGHLTTDVIAEPDDPPSSAGPAEPEGSNNTGAVRVNLAAISRQAMRTRSEGFDD
jgi:hypothetical protein